jgi:molybdopterin converting factor small subunit
MIRVKALYFGQLRERRGRQQEVLEAASRLTVRELYQRVFAGTPESGLTVAFARNETYVDPQAQIDDGDVIAFLPPVGGG